MNKRTLFLMLAVSFAVSACSAHKAVVKVNGDFYKCSEAEKDYYDDCDRI